MTNQHPITPPPELVKQWMTEYTETKPNCLGTEFIAARAAQWGADQELEACCEWLDDASLHLDGSYLRAARRPNPPSLKESALNALEHILRHSQTDHGANTIRRALEQLK